MIAYFSLLTITFDVFQSILIQICILILTRVIYYIEMRIVTV